MSTEQHTHIVNILSAVNSKNMLCRYMEEASAHGLPPGKLLDNINGRWHDVRYHTPQTDFQMSTTYYYTTTRMCSSNDTLTESS